MQKLAIFIITLALISAMVTKFLFGPCLLNDEQTDVMYERILVLSIHMYGDDWEKKIRQIISTAVYKENITVCIILICDKIRKPISIPMDLQQKVCVTYVTNREKNLVKKPLEKIHTTEKYICIFNKSTPYENWDVNCLDIINENIILTATPSLGDTPTFPTVKKNKGIMTNGNLKSFYSMKTNATPSSCISSNFIFACSKNILQVDFGNSMIEETIRSPKKIMTPCFPIVKGKYVHSTKCYDTGKKYHSNMSIGLSKFPMDSECIAKYGSVEAAKLQIEFNT